MNKEHSHVKTCRMHPHWHVYVCLSRSRRRNVFPLELLQKHWISAIVSRGGNSHAEACQKYVNYIKGKGPGWRLIGQDPQDHLTQVKSRMAARKGKIEQIKELIVQGKRRREILEMLPQLSQNISKLMELRPPKETSHLLSVPP